MNYEKGWFLSVLLGVVLFIFFFIQIGCANPIPVYPDPEPEYFSPSISNTGGVPAMWMVFVFFLDFGINIIIIYGGVLLLQRYRNVSSEFLFEVSKTRFLSSIFFVSLVGLLSELILGPWIGGLLVALLFIFLSFVFIARFLFVFCWEDSLLMGIFALMVNIVVWSVIFMV